MGIDAVVSIRSPRERSIVGNMHVGIFLRRAIPICELTVFYGKLPLV
jgi:hypothetical protein